jgi:hypothetical protein
MRSMKLVSSFFDRNRMNLASRRWAGNQRGLQSTRIDPQLVPLVTGRCWVYRLALR